MLARATVAKPKPARRSARASIAASELEQAQDVIEYVEGRKRELRYKGPDFFLVKGVDGTKRHGNWVVWEPTPRTDPRVRYRHQRFLR
ncbi:MAG: hypothetical protein ACK4RG_08410 [Fimbriimonadales bacterium]